MSSVRQAGKPGGRRAGSSKGAPGGAPSARVAPAPRAPDSDADDGAPMTPSAGPASPPTGRRRGGAPWWALAITSAVAVLAVLALVVVLFARPSEQALRDSALLAGRSYVTDLTTYDARTLDTDVAKVKKISSPQFAKEYDANIAKVRDTILKAQTVSTATVVGAGVEKLTGDSATVLVAVNQTFQAPGQQPRTEANRVRVVLVRTNGNWYLNGVTRL